MTKRKRKGFTIVELVIVIAVIGILAGILIPLFTSFVRDANIASDELLIRELNNALAIDTAETGKAHETIFDALNATDACGFNVQKINAKASRNRILWDSVNDTFCYLKDEDGETTLVYQNSTVKEIDKLNKNDYRLWAIQKTVDEVYSTYLYKYNGSATITTNLGLDTSDASNGEISSISYIRTGVSDERLVYIRTNSASVALTINAPTDVVKHHGTVGSLNIVAVAGESYHEYGKVAFVEISNGRYAIEAGAEVEHIHLTATVTETGSIFNNIVVAKASEVEMPDFSRDPVDIPAEGKLVVALQDGTEATADKDYVWLTAVGIYEQVTVSDSKTNAGNNYAAETATEERKETAQQIANNITINAGGDTYTVKAEKTATGWEYVLVDETETVSTDYTISGTPEVTVTVTVSETETTTTTTVVVEVLDNNEQAVETTQVIENGLDETAKVEARTEIVQEVREAGCPGHVMFNDETKRLYHNCPHCGLEFGTEEHPYLISNAEELEALIKLNDWTGYNGYYQVYRTDGTYYQYLYAELTQNIDCSSISYPTGYSNVYYLVLNGNNYTLSNMSENPFNNGYGITIKNLTFNNFTGKYLMYYAYYGFEFENVTFNNCSNNYIVQYPIKGASEGDFYCKNVNFNNCEFNSVFSYLYDSHLTMEDCTFNNCRSKSGSSLLANGCYHNYSGYALGATLKNVDIRNSTAYGGAYIYYGGVNDCTFKFENCDVVNTNVLGGNGMALGGFVGNASASHLVFDYCSFDGRIESVSQIAAGFVGQPNNSASYCLISNSSISAGTVILNKGGNAVAVFNGQGNSYNNNNNHFYGTLQSTGTISNATLNGFTNASFAKYNTVATISDFVLEADGTIRYTGSGSFDKIRISQKLAVDEMKSGLGGYPWQVAPTLEVENVSGETTLGTIEMVSDFVQVVDQEHLELVRYASTDAELLTGDWSDEGHSIYLDNGKLILDSREYSSGSWYIFSNTQAEKTKTTFTISVLIEILVGNEVVCAVPMSYNFTPTV